MTTEISTQNYPGSWTTVTGKVIRELHLVLEVELYYATKTQTLMIPKTIIAENSYTIGKEQPLQIQRWFLLRNRIIPFER